MKTIRTKEQNNRPLTLTFPAGYALSCVTVGAFGWSATLARLTDGKRIRFHNGQPVTATCRRGRTEAAEVNGRNRFPGLGITFTWGH